MEQRRLHTTGKNNK